MKENKKGNTVFMNFYYTIAIFYGGYQIYIL